MGFTKLDERILQSSIMAESAVTFKVWITLLAACRENGVAYVSAVYISTICHLPISRVEDALKKLEAPDEHSRSIKDDGRRIRRIDGGFEIINYAIYRDVSLRDAEAERKRLYRQRLRGCPDNVPQCPDPSASASASASVIFYKGGTWEGIQAEDMESWAKAYPACDLGVEFAKMREWLISNPKKAVKKNWRRFITNWLSRSQERGGTFPAQGRGEHRVSQVGKNPSGGDPDDPYWIETRRLKSLGLEGQALTSALEEWKKKQKGVTPCPST